MNKIRLERIYSSSDSVHVKLLINNKDVGVLYLKEEEADLLLKSLKNGCYINEVEIESNIFDEEDDFDSDIDEE